MGDYNNYMDSAQLECSSNVSEIIKLKGNEK